MTERQTEVLAALDWIPTCGITDRCSGIATWCWWSRCGHHGGLACGPCTTLAWRLDDRVHRCPVCDDVGLGAHIINWKGL